MTKDLSLGQGFGIGVRPAGRREVTMHRVALPMGAHRLPEVLDTVFCFPARSRTATSQISLAFDRRAVTWDPPQNFPGLTPYQTVAASPEYLTSMGNENISTIKIC